MRAIILAAGLAQRLGKTAELQPKTLLRFGEHSLIQRHLEHLSTIGVTDVSIVVGHLANKIEDEVAKTLQPMPVQFLYNDRYREGNAISLLCAVDIFTQSDTIIMDGDILCGQEMYERLRFAPHRNCVLADGSFEDSGEEVKVVADDSRRVIGLGKKPLVTETVVGESVGIFRFDANFGKRFATQLDVASKIDNRIEYETVIGMMLDNSEVGFAAVDDLPWTEIDFQEDVEHATNVVFPALVGEDIHARQRTRNTLPRN